jgi:hypothetical protein
MFKYFFIISIIRNNQYIQILFTYYKYIFYDYKFLFLNIFNIVSFIINQIRDKYNLIQYTAVINFIYAATT